MLFIITKSNSTKIRTTIVDAESEESARLRFAPRWDSGWEIESVELLSDLLQMNDGFVRVKFKEL